MIKNKIALVKESVTQNQFESFKQYLDDGKILKGAKVLDVIYKNYINEKKYLKDRAEISEDLAAVGIAVETASHDLMMMMQRAMQTLSSVIELTESKIMTRKFSIQISKKLHGQITYIESQIEGIQPIFRSSKGKANRFENHFCSYWCKTILRWSNWRKQYQLCCWGSWWEEPYCQLHRSSFTSNIHQPFRQLCFTG